LYSNMHRNTLTFIVLFGHGKSLSIMRSLHDVHEMNAYRTDHVCLSVRLSVRIIQLHNRWSNLDDICYGRNAIRSSEKS
jgi:hypothetical protein